MILRSILAIGCAGARRSDVMSADVRNIEAELLSDLIGAIYDCVIDPGRWEVTLDRLRGLLDCINCILSVTDLHNAVVRVQKMWESNRNGSLGCRTMRLTRRH
jgi:hypothetical protein